MPDYLKDGVILDGLFIEGCTINDEGKLEDYTSKQLITKCRYIEYLIINHIIKIDYNRFWYPNTRVHSRTLVRCTRRIKGQEWSLLPAIPPISSRVLICRPRDIVNIGRGEALHLYVRSMSDHNISFITHYFI